MLRFDDVPSNWLKVKDKGSISFTPSNIVFDTEYVKAVMGSSYASYIYECDTL